MTGSGKTGLGVVLIEEVLRAGIPVIAIDPKGDLTNLRLMFPDLAPADFRPWIDESQAKNAGQSPDDFAAAQATLWSDGLGKWGVTGADIGALVDATDVTVYTPGSTSGVPLNLVGSLQVPADMGDAETVADEINGYVSGLLGLVGIEADPLSSREHILLSNLIHHSWEQGQALDLPTLVGQVATPPIRKLGVFELDQFFPEKDRMALAMKLNGLLASPSFAAWAEGGPLDIASMLFVPTGPPAVPSSRSPTCPTRSASSSPPSCCRSWSPGCASRAAPPTCGRCSTWTRSPGTSHRPPTHRRSSRSCC